MEMEMEVGLAYNELPVVEQIGVAKMIADEFKTHLSSVGVEVEFEELMAAAMMSLTPLTIYNVLTCYKDEWYSTE